VIWFLFVNARRNGRRVLVWDGTGLCIFMKRLERSRFAAVWRDEGDVVTLTASELALFIEGCELVGHRKLSPTAIVPAPLGTRSRRDARTDRQPPARPWWTTGEHRLPAWVGSVGVRSTSEPRVQASSANREGRAAAAYHSRKRN
jgi:hypothetical protein